MKEQLSDLHNQIVTFLQENKSGVSALELAQNFLKFTAPSPQLAQKMIYNILKDDRRCYLDKDSLWKASQEQIKKDAQKISELPLSPIFILAKNVGSTYQIYYCSIWTLDQTPQCIYQFYLPEFTKLSFEEQDLFCPGCHSNLTITPYDQFSRMCADILESRLPIFLNTKEYGFILRTALQNGETFPEDYMIITELLNPAEISYERPLTVSTLSKAVFSSNFNNANLLKQGEQFSNCISELLTLLAQKGITLREDLENYQKETNQVPFTSPSITWDMLSSIAKKPGVYGFKNKDGKFIYIGKAKNLYQRLKNYFVLTDESPAKLDQLRKNATELITYYCGSEIEALLYEYRLIKKHNPELNTQITINERPGTFTPIQDCIILLPHAEPEKGMSLWFRKNQKITIRPFLLTFNEPNIEQDLDEFFFTNKLSIDPDDFPELEIATRWVKRHSDTLNIVPIERFANAKEIFDAMKFYWTEAK